MTKDDAKTKIIKILSTHTDLDEDRLFYLAERIFLDVVGPAVHDECQTWVELSTCRDPNGEMDS